MLRAAFLRLVVLRVCVVFVCFVTINSDDFCFDIDCRSCWLLLPIQFFCFVASPQSFAMQGVVKGMKVKHTSSLPKDATLFIKEMIARHSGAVKDVSALLAKNKVTEVPTQTQLDFWAACYLIPKGKVVSYGVLARIVQGARGEQFDTAKLSRIAGKAMSQNPVAPTVPCHRVVGSNGLLTGFKGNSTSCNLSEKATLLAAEGVAVVISNGVYAVKDADRLIR